MATLSDPADQRRSVAARAVAEGFVDAEGALRRGLQAFAAELADGWLARVGAGEALAEPGVDEGLGMGRTAPAPAIVDG